MSDSIIHLSEEFFQPQKRRLITSGTLRADTFQFPSGVSALELENERGRLVVLPFQGQQVWSAWMDGRELTMHTIFEQPYPTRDFLSTFGGFLVHCGGTARGIPGQQATRPLHGELPNAPYPLAEVILGEDEQGKYIGLSGQYQCQVFFYYNFLVRPVVKLYSGSSLFHVLFQIHNLKQTPMEISYLAHVNFRPVDGGRLVYSAICDPDHMRVRTALPSHVESKPGYQEFVNDLARHPEKHLLLQAGQPYDPEIVLNIDYLADEEGWARQMQIHPDGTADVVRHRPKQLGRGLRWISRTPDQDAIGFEPASGFRDQPSVELGPQETFFCELQIGSLTPEEAAAEEKIAVDTIANYS